MLVLNYTCYIRQSKEKPKIYEDLYTEVVHIPNFEIQTNKTVAGCCYFLTEVCGRHQIKR